MKISKYIHSCLLFEEAGYKLLIDPGKFTFIEGLVKPEDFEQVNTIVITHIHPDHFDPENLKVIAELSKAPIYTTAEVGKALAEAGLNCTLLEEKVYEFGPFRLSVFPVKHQPLLDSPTPKMFGFVLNDKVLHPVDSFESTMIKYKGIQLLLLPVMAPFATELNITAFADELQPKEVLPLHDGFAKEFFVKQRYKVYSEHFEKQGIKFHPVNTPGAGIEI